MSRMEKSLSLIVALSAGAIVACAGPANVDEGPVASLSAFTRLYGLVRFFHPSDEAAATDWDRFAAYGARRVLSASDEDLGAVLEELFSPIASTLEIYPAGAAGSAVGDHPPGSETSASSSEEAQAGISYINWQHQGVLISPGRPNVYLSVRTNRESRMAAANLGFGTLAQALDATAYRGRMVRLRARVRVDARGIGNQAQLWLRVDRASGEGGFFDNMQDRPITGTDWRIYEINGPVAEDAERIAFGALVQGLGAFEFDDFAIETAGDDGEWRVAEIADGGFERGSDAIRFVAGGDPVRPSEGNAWFAVNPGYQYLVEADTAGRGMVAVIRTLTRPIVGPLFETRPDAGAYVERELGAGLRVRMPISLPADSAGTLPRAPAASLAALSATLDSIDIVTASPDRPEVRVAAVVVAWNVFQHFYPYFDVVDVDWSAVLGTALGRALADPDGEAFFTTLRWMVAQLQDGHGQVYHPAYNPTGDVQWRLAWIEDQVVVTASQDSAVRRGDIVRAIGGEPIEDVVAQAFALTSGSQQWKRYWSLIGLGLGPRGDTVSVRVLRGGTEVSLALVRGARTAVVEFERPAIEQIEAGLWYVDLDRAAWPSIQAVLDDLAAADGVIFDLRGYPAGNHLVLQHLLPSPDTSTAWMLTPRFLYPDQDQPAGQRENGWSLQSAEPRIEGRVVFITDSRAISYAESLLSFVEHYRLGEIVGQPTAGANGNVNPFAVPGGYTLVFTGMRVVKHDGSQHHLVGIQPTRPVQRTLAGVLDGRDELLEVALSMVHDQR